MNEKQRATPPPGMNLQDILYIVFRHKWKILAITLLGFLGAALLPRFWLVAYESEARLYIRYVVETTAPNQLSEKDTRIKALDARGDNIINTELEILTSRDLARQVAASVGPERLLSKAGETNLDWAALVVQSGVRAEVPKDSSVVTLVFRHRDPEVLQPVLRQLIDLYFKKHAEIHAVGAFDEFLTQETDQLRSHMVQTDDELRKAKAKAGVISLEASKSAYSEQVSRIQAQLLDAEAELAERRASAAELAKVIQPVATVSTNETPSPSYPLLPEETVREYRQVCSQLESLGRREQELLITFTSSNSLVKEVRARIESNGLIKKRLEGDYPGLLVARLPESSVTPGAQVAVGRLDLATEKARVSALEAKVKVLTTQLEDIRSRAASVAEAEGAISALQTRRDLEEAHYRKFSENLAQSQLDERLGAGKVSNISIIEEPTAPVKAKSKLLKMMAGLVLGGFGLALGLAFLIELYLDQSVRRPGEVESKLGLPLFLNIPWAGRNGCTAISDGKQAALLGESGETTIGSGGGESETGTGMELAPQDASHTLQQYYDALRDRLITYFEMKGLTHKPKLVAVTSCAQGSGVSTVAAGLAASLSETGDGNVLLVNMSLQNGAAHHFRKGELACGLEEALQTGKRHVALVQENLYVVNEVSKGDQLLPLLPKRFKQLVPRLKASDFDYIIFDLPPVSQISITPRLARFMDVVLVVVETGKTGRELVKKASSLLADSNANIGIVLNKGREYVPERFR